MDVVGPAGAFVDYGFSRRGDCISPDAKSQLSDAGGFGSPRVLASCTMATQLRDGDSKRFLMVETCKMSQPSRESKH